MYFQFPPCVQGVHQNYSTLHEKCPNMEFFQVRIFLYSEWIRRDTKYFSKYTNLFIFTKEIFYWKVSFLCSVYHNRQYAKHVKWKTKKKDMKDVKNVGKASLEMLSQLNTLVSDVMNLLYYEHWTDKRNYFYLYQNVLCWSHKNMTRWWEKYLSKRNLINTILPGLRGKIYHSP